MHLLSGIDTALIKATKDNSLEIKKASIEALGKIGPAATDAVPALAAALKGPEKEVRESVAKAKANIQDSQKS
jgi:HEAT repeat protein